MHGLMQRLLAEAVGTAFLLMAVVGSGIAAQRLSPGDVGLQLFENAVATAFALMALIWAFGPVSGAHFNPAVTLADVVLQRRPVKEGVGLHRGAGGWRHRRHDAGQPDVRAAGGELVNEGTERAGFVAGRGYCHPWACCR